MLILKIIIYYIILFMTLFVIRSKIIILPPMATASLMLFIYLASYLVLLTLEIRFQLKKKAPEKDIKKAAFWFSSWAWAGFGILFTFYKGYPTFFYSIAETFGVLLGCFFGMALGGMAGVALALVIIPFLKWTQDLFSRLGAPQNRAGKSGI